MFHPIDKWNVRLGNDLYVDLKVIVHETTAKIIVTARYMHLWHECIAMTNGKIMVRLKTDT